MPIIDNIDGYTCLNTADKKVKICILAIDGCLFDENYADAETNYKIASRYQRDIKDNKIKLQFNVCASQICDFNRKYIDSASILLRVINADPNDLIKAFNDKFGGNCSVDDIILTLIRFAANSVIVAQAAPQVLFFILIEISFNK